jgi:hypothetical protein
MIVKIFLIMNSEQMLFLKLINCKQTEWYFEEYEHHQVDKHPMEICLYFISRKHAEMGNDYVNNPLPQDDLGREIYVDSMGLNISDEFINSINWTLSSYMTRIFSRYIETLNILPKREILYCNYLVWRSFDSNYDPLDFITYFNNVNHNTFYYV